MTDTDLLTLDAAEKFIPNADAAARASTIDDRATPLVVLPLQVGAFDVVENEREAFTLVEVAQPHKQIG